MSGERAALVYLARRYYSAGLSTNPAGERELQIMRFFLLAKGEIIGTAENLQRAKEVESLIRGFESPDGLALLMFAYLKCADPEIKPETPFTDRQINLATDRVSSKGWLGAGEEEL